MGGSTEVGALFLLGKDGRILVLTPDTSKIKALTSIINLSSGFQPYESYDMICESKIFKSWLLKMYKLES